MAGAPRHVSGVSGVQASAHERGQENWQRNGTGTPRVVVLFQY